VRASYSFVPARKVKIAANTPPSSDGSRYAHISRASTFEKAATLAACIQ
jgi:hypothetical protein